MNNGPKLSPRSRNARTILTCAACFVGVLLFPTWPTVAVLACIGAAWLGGTVVGFMADEYFPTDPTARDWTPRRREPFPRRWR